MDRVGFVGLGTMGAAMAANIARAGIPLSVWNRSPGRAAGLVDAGAIEVATPAEAARAADIVVTCVSDTGDVEAVLFGPHGVAAGAPKGLLVVDGSTISPSATRDFAARLATAGAESRCSMRRFRAEAKGPRRERCRSSSGAPRPTWSGRPRSSRQWARRSPTSVPSVPARPSRPSTR